MHKGKLLLAILLMLFGVFMVVYGGADDSPGAQGLGLVMAVGGVMVAVRSRKTSGQK